VQFKYLIFWEIRVSVPGLAFCLRMESIKISWRWINHTRNQLIALVFQSGPSLFFIFNQYHLIN
jgi:hypothetical protein